LIKTTGEIHASSGFLVKAVHKAGNHSALPELQENQDTSTQGFKKGLKYDGKKTLQISTWKKPHRHLSIQVSIAKDSSD